MDSVEMLKQLAIIVIFAKVFGLLARKIKVPQVAGEIVAGLLIGPSLLGWVSESELISGIAEIGVIMLMFSAGLTTNLTQLKKSGLKATLIACAGVFVPLICGTVLYMVFYGFDTFGSDQFYKAIFIGTILTATSVSITVETLKELGKLSEFIGTTIVSAAIIDDVIGILVLTVVIGFKDPTTKIWSVVLHTILFFLFAVVVGYIVYKVFKFVDKRYPHTRRIPILGLALAFSMSYIAERFFGVADITGAFVAGIILCSLSDSDYIEEKMDINSYMLFGPVFFCSIGLQTNISSVNPTIIWFSVAFVLVGMLSKIIGCGSMARLTGFGGKDCLKIGVGMMTRGEVALIVAQRGLTVGMLDQAYFTSVILLIITSSILTPIILKLLYGHRKNAVRNGETADEEHSEAEAVPSPLLLDDTPGLKNPATENKA